MMSSQSSSKGFTLVELLTALLILSVIATFTIPKILSSQQNAKRKAILKETYATLSQIHYVHVMEGAQNEKLAIAYFATRINALKICQNNAQSEGCWTHPINTPTNLMHGGLILHNGARLVGIENGSAIFDGSDLLPSTGMDPKARIWKGRISYIWR